MNETKLRLVNLVKLLLVLIALAVFLLVLNSFGIRIPCLFYTVTGLKCPGCGVTRMCLSLLHGNLYAAFYYNKVVTLLIPFLAIMFVRQSYLYVFKGQITLSKLENIFLIAAVVVLLIYGVLRNLAVFSIF